jgi:hypothetical protein
VRFRLRLSHSGPLFAQARRVSGSRSFPYNNHVTHATLIPCHVAFLDQPSDARQLAKRSLPLAQCGEIPPSFRSQ